MNLDDQKKSMGHFNIWQLQNKIALLSLVAILILSALFAVSSITLPHLETSHLMAFVILIPTLACFGIAASHASSLESARALREHESILKRLSESEGSQISLDRFFSISSDLMAVAGSEGVLRKVSKSLVKALGHSEETLLSTPFFEFVHPDDRESTRKNIEGLNMGLRSVNFVNRYRTKDGSYRTLSWSAAADIELGVRFASARDVTDERNFRIRGQQILDAAPFMLVVKDLDGVITECNSAFVLWSGFSSENIVGRKLKSLLSEEMSESLMKYEQAVLTTQSPQVYEEMFPKGGTLEKYQSTVFPVLNQSGQVVAIGKYSINLG